MDPIWVVMGLVAAFAAYVGWHEWKRKKPPPAASAPLRQAPRQPLVSELGAAVEAGDLARVKELLSAGADPNEAARDDLPALHVAAASGHDEVADALIDADASLAHADPYVGGVLAQALAARHVHSALALMEAGADIHAVNDGGATPLHYAAILGDLEVVRALVERGVNVDVRNFHDGTPLRSASDGGHLEVVEFLLSRGAKADVVDLSEKRPIDYARERGHAAVVQALTDAGGDTPVPPRDDDAPRWHRWAPVASLLPPRTNSTLRSFLDAESQGARITRMACSSLEAPTLVLSLQSVLGESFQVLTSNHDRPDPRLAVRPVRRVLWRYEGDATSPQRAVPHPPPAIDALVRSLAIVPYSLRVWSEHAARAAKDVDEAQLDALVAAMVHPGPTPPYLRPWSWFFRYQVAAALLVSHVGASEWSGSARREALLDVIDGPSDWSNTAAILALYDVARRDPRARPHVLEDLLAAARRELTPPSYANVILPAAMALLELGGHDATVEAELRDLARDY